MKYPSRRGTVLILIVVMMALLALVGAAYLQVTRLDREASRITTGNIDTVCDAIVARIQNVLANDLRDGTGKFFDPGVYINAFDYGFNASSLAGGTMGQLDDCWLAAAALDGGNNWPHITALMPDTDPANARYLTNWDTTNLRFTAATPGDEAVVNGVAPRDTAVAHTAANLVDADGDGIPDSRWQWATLKSIGDTQYVMAVRIIDNSALLNLNVAGSAVATDGNYQPDGGNKYYAARFWTPADVDLGGFIYAAAGYTSARMTDLQALLRFRYNNVGLGLPLYAWNTSNTGDPLSTLNFWINGPATDFAAAGNYKTFALTDERELRFRNGLNDPKSTAIIEYAGAGMPAVMRSSILTETAYNNAQSPNYYSTPLIYLTNEPRHQLTTLSGATVYRPQASTGSPNDLFYLPSLWTGNASVRTEFQNLLKADNMPFGDVGSNNTLPFGNANTAADQYLACLLDYFAHLNQGSAITRLGNGANARYGMKALPFLTEVYVQGAYWLTGVTEQAPAGSKIYNLTWTLQTPIGYAIEIINPFATQVLDLRHVKLRVNGTDWGTDLATLAGGATTLDPRQGIILYRNSAGSGTTGDLKALMGWTLPSGWREAAITQDMPANQDVVVELLARVRDDAGNLTSDWVVYSRIQRKAGDGGVSAEQVLNLPNTVELTGVDYSAGTPPTPGGAAHERFIQRTAYCKTTALNPIAVVVKDGTNQLFGNGTSGTFTAPAGVPPDPVAPVANIGQITQENKTGSDWVEPWKSTDGSANAALRAYRFDHGGTARYVTDLLRVMWVGPTGTQTYAEVFAEAAPTTIAQDTQTPTPANDSVRTRMISLTDIPTGATDDQVLPRGQALLDRVTCIYTDKTRTPLMQGRINLNTAPYSVLVTALPIADNTLRQTVAAQIVAHRQGQNTDGVNTWTRTRGTRRGFASLGELLQLPAVQAWARDNAVTDTSGGVQIAFDSAGRPVTSHASAKDDRTEEVRLAGFLANLCSVRSDVFTAYVIVRGYAGSFTADPSESARFIAVFDRSNVKSPNDMPKVLAVFRLN